MNKRGFLDLQQQSFYFEALERTLPKGQETVYHYTSTRVLDSLLTKGTMWASNIFYLNDNIEYKAGIDALRKSFQRCQPTLNIIEKLEEDNGHNWPSVFTVSFSNAPDELQQWVTYGKESGVSIEFDIDPLRGKGDERSLSLYFKYKDSDDPSSSSHFESPNSHFYPISYIPRFNNNQDLPNDIRRNIRKAFREVAKFKVDCYYDCSTCSKVSKCKFESTAGDFFLKNKNLDKSVASCLDCENCNDCWVKNPEYEEYAKEFFRILATYHKVNTFHGEGEVRTSFFPFKDENGDKLSEILHAHKNNGLLRPYIEVKFGKQKTSKKPELAVPIKSITVGPSGIQDKLYDSIVHRIKYGKHVVWKPNEETLKKRIEDYLVSVCSDYDKEHLKIAKYLLKKWNEENGKEYTITEAQGTKDTLSFKIGTTKTNKPEDGEELSEAVNALRYNYLSPDGLWVKKSKIEFIF